MDLKIRKINQTIHNSFKNQIRVRTLKKYNIPIAQYSPIINNRTWEPSHFFPANSRLASDAIHYLAPVSAMAAEAHLKLVILGQLQSEPLELTTEDYQYIKRWHRITISCRTVEEQLLAHGIGLDNRFMGVLNTVWTDMCYTLLMCIILHSEGWNLIKPLLEDILPDLENNMHEMIILFGLELRDRILARLPIGSLPNDTCWYRYVT